MTRGSTISFKNKQSKGGEDIIKETMADSFPEFMNDLIPQTEDTQKSKISKNLSETRLIIVAPQNCNNKESSKTNKKSETKQKQKQKTEIKTIQK